MVRGLEKMEKFNIFSDISVLRNSPVENSAKANEVLTWALSLISSDPEIFQVRIGSSSLHV